MKKVFISYSHEDRDFIKKITDRLPKDTYWVDYINLDVGDNILDKIESGIIECSEFLLILSKHSLNSKWVKQESDMAIIRSLKDGFMKIRVIKIDDCDIPLRFHPCKYLSIEEDKTHEKMVDKIIEFLLKKEKGEEGSFEFRRFVNRNREIDQLQEHIFDKDVKIVVLTGIYGIGKTSLLMESISRIWKNPKIIKISFTGAFIGSRLCNELCALANILLPSDKATDEEIRKITIKAVEELISQNKIIIFDDFHNILDENGVPNQDVGFLIKHCIKIELLRKTPLFIISNRKPNLMIEAEAPDVSKILKVRGLDNKYIEIILKMELKDISKYESIETQEKVKFIENLCNYPLAAKFAAPLLDDYSLEFIITNIKYIKQLRIDLARILLSKVRLSVSQEQILELLGFSGDYLDLKEATEILKRDKEDMLKDIDYLVQHNFFEFDKLKIGLHPILIDIFASKAMTSGIVKLESDKLIDSFKKLFNNTKKGTLEYVHWLSRLQRVYLITGKFDEAISLWHNCRGELKMAINDLYSRKRDYRLALQYCDKYLDDDPEDFSVKIFKVKCLIRVQGYDTALKIIEELLVKQPKILSYYIKKQEYLCIMIQ